MFEQTADPDVFITNRYDDVIEYIRIDGLRWQVKGACDRRGHCLVGAVIDGILIRSVEHLNEVAKGCRIDSQLDVPVSPTFRGCCPFEIEILQ